MREPEDNQKPNVENEDITVAIESDDSVKTALVHIDGYMRGFTEGVLLVFKIALIAFAVWCSFRYFYESK